MKLIVTITCILLGVQGGRSEGLDEIKEALKPKIEECKAEIGATEDDIASLKGPNQTPTEKGKCFASCIMEKQGYFDESGKLNKEQIRAVMEKIKPSDPTWMEKHIQIMEACFDTVTEESDKCEMAGKAFSCIFRSHHGSKE